MDFTNQLQIQARALLFLSLMTISACMAYGQESTERHRTYIGLEYVKAVDHTFLTASLTARVKGVRGRQKLENVEIQFYHLRDTTQHFMGSAVTDEDGDARFLLDEPETLSLNADGALAFVAVFQGNEEYGDISEEIEIQPATLELTFIEEDSVKYIAVSAYQVSKTGDREPIDEDVMVYVPRQFSRLTIGEIELDEGEGEIEFPVTLPGDSVGNLTIIASIEESGDYGTIEVEARKDWGMARVPVVIEKRRGLGDTDAPLWMVYTLIILMSAVWFHYLYILFVIYLIKRNGQITP